MKSACDRKNKTVTDQMKKWGSSFGQRYTERNPKTSKDTDDMYKNTIVGLTRTQLNREFLSGLKIDKILEVGSNVGAQLLVLSDMGYKNLYGIDLQEGAVDLAKSNTKGRDINIIKASAFDIPFKDGYFDLVFTSTVLIHISPDDIGKIMDEIYRCSKQYIFGYEYYSDRYTMIDYRGEKNLLWKADFPGLFLKRFDDLRIVKKKIYKRLDNPDNSDVMYLLEKTRKEKK